MIKSSQKVFDVLEFLCTNGAAKAIEVSESLALQKSSVHRFLNTLVEIGYVQKDELSGRFGPTLKIFKMGIAVSNRIDIVENSRRVMRNLATELDMTVSLATLMDNAVLIVRREYPKSGITRIVMNQQLPAYCTGIGKALLSMQSQSFIEQYLEKIPLIRYTSATITSAAKLKDALWQAHDQGYAEDVCEISDALHCVAVPFSDISNPQPWAVSVSGNSAAVKAIGVAFLVEQLKQVTTRIASSC